MIKNKKVPQIKGVGQNLVNLSTVSQLKKEITIFSEKDRKIMYLIKSHRYIRPNWMTRVRSLVLYLCVTLIHYPSRGRSSIVFGVR